MQPVQNAAIEGQPLFHLVPVQAGINRKHQKAIRPETRVVFQQADQCLGKKRRPDQQRNGERQLSCH